MVDDIYLKVSIDFPQKVDYLRESNSGIWRSQAGPGLRSFLAGSCSFRQPTSGSGLKPVGS